MHRFNFGSAIFAGIIATAAMTISLLFFGMDIMKFLGNAAGMQKANAYIVGGILHFAVGIIFAIIYALIFEPLFKGLPKFLSGAIYSLFPFILAMTLIGPVVKLIQTVFGVQNATSQEMMCSPCPGMECCPEYGFRYDSPFNMQKTAYSCYPCKPPYYRDYDGGKTRCGMCNPCNPCRMSTMMCSPCGANGVKGPGWLWNLINHLIYGIVLGIVYRPHLARRQ